MQFLSKFQAVSWAALRQIPGPVLDSWSKAITGAALVGLSAGKVLPRTPAYWCRAHRQTAARDSDRCPGDRSGRSPHRVRSSSRAPTRAAIAGSGGFAVIDPTNRIKTALSGSKVILRVFRPVKAEFRALSNRGRRK